MGDWRERATITVEQAAPILGIGRSTAYVLARTGELPTLKLGRRYLVPTAKLRALLGENDDAVRAVNTNGVSNSAGGDGQHERYRS